MCKSQRIEQGRHGLILEQSESDYVMNLETTVHWGEKQTTVICSTAFQNASKQCWRWGKRKVFTFFLQEDRANCRDHATMLFWEKIVLKGLPRLHHSPYQFWQGFITANKHFFSLVKCGSISEWHERRKMERGEGSRLLESQLCRKSLLWWINLFRLLPIGMAHFLNCHSVALMQWRRREKGGDK